MQICSLLIEKQCWGFTVLMLQRSFFFVLELILQQYHLNTLCEWWDVSPSRRWKSDLLSNKTGWLKKSSHDGIDVKHFSNGSLLSLDKVKLSSLTEKYPTGYWKQITEGPAATGWVRWGRVTLPDWPYTSEELMLRTKCSRSAADGELRQRDGRMRQLARSCEDGEGMSCKKKRNGMSLWCEVSVSADG